MYTKNLNFEIAFLNWNDNILGIKKHFIKVRKYLQNENLKNINFFFDSALE